MALPFLIPMLMGAVAGAAMNPEDRLRGALMGGTLGALTGGMGAGAAAGSGAAGSGLAATGAQSALGTAVTNTAAQTAASHAAANTAAQTAAAEAAKQGLSNEVIRQASIPVVEQGMSSAVINSGVQANALAAKEAALVADATQKAALTKDAVVGADAASKSGLQFADMPAGAGTGPNYVARPTSGGVFSEAELLPSIQEGGVNIASPAERYAGKVASQADKAHIARNSSEIGLNIQPPVVDTTPLSLTERFAGGADTALEFVKENPMESMMAVNMLAPQQQSGGGMVMAPVTQPQITPPPSVEERIATSGAGAPTFVPKGLFDETRSSLDEEEERRMMFEQLTAAGLV